MRRNTNGTTPSVSCLITLFLLLSTCSSFPPVEATPLQLRCDCQCCEGAGCAANFSALFPDPRHVLVILPTVGSVIVPWCADCAIALCSQYFPQCPASGEPGANLQYCVADLPSVATSTRERGCTALAITVMLSMAVVAVNELLTGS